MAGIETDQLAGLRGIAQIKIVRSDRVRLRADAEEFRFDRVEDEGLVDRLRKDFVEGFPQPFARRKTVGRNVFESVRRPLVADRRRAERRPNSAAMRRIALA